MKAGSMAKAKARHPSGRLGHQPIIAEVPDWRDHKLTYSESPLSESAETPRFLETIWGSVSRFIGEPRGDRRIESLAVLPLENLSGDPEQEYFADGLTE